MTAPSRLHDIQRRVSLLLVLATTCCTTSGSEPPAGLARANTPAHSTEASPEPEPEPERWAAMSALAAPPGREDHSAVWTGTEMLVWGGEIRADGITVFGDGARYSPSEDVWRPMSVAAGTDRRDDHAVVWTGTEMIIWGGNQADESTELLASGARYNPATNLWTPLPLGPLSARDDATAVWTGREMIVWGGRTFGWVHEQTGARYDPALDRWQDTSMRGAPHAREDHSAVWTGSEMIIWGGWSGDDDRRDHASDGARYDPLADSWRPIASRGAPSPREDHSAIWTGSEMIIWGGVVHRYPAAPEPNAPPEQAQVEQAHVDEVHVEDAPVEKAPRRQLVQLSSGARYDPTSDTWQPMSSVGAPSAREDHVAIWTGRELVIWGGRHDKTKLGDGAIYEPATDRWRPLASDGPTPSPRWNPTAVWTGSEVIIWGGRGDGYPSEGGRYMW